ARDRPRRPRRGRTRAAGGGASADQRAPARGDHRAAEVRSRVVRPRTGRGHVEGQAGGRCRSRRARAADHLERDRLPRSLDRGGGLPDPPPAEQPGADSAYGRRRARARPPVVSDHAPTRRRAGPRDPSTPRTGGAVAALPPDVERQLENLAPGEVAVSVPTYNNAATISKVVEAIRAGLGKDFEGVPAGLINTDAGSSDATTERVGEAALPLVRATHPAPPGQLAAVPFPGVPGRGASIQLSLGVARRLGARALVMLEADAVSIDDEGLHRLVRPGVGEGAHP